MRPVYIIGCHLKNSEHQYFSAPKYYRLCFSWEIQVDPKSCAAILGYTLRYLCSNNSWKTRTGIE